MNFQVQWSYYVGIFSAVGERFGMGYCVKELQKSKCSSDYW
jgi:hypothetical protein